MSINHTIGTGFSPFILKGNETPVEEKYSLVHSSQALRLNRHRASETRDVLAKCSMLWLNQLQWKIKC